MIPAPCSQTRKASWLLGPDSFHIPLIYKPLGRYHGSLVTLPHSLESALAPPFPMKQPSESIFCFTPSMTSPSFPSCVESLHPADPHCPTLSWS